MSRALQRPVLTLAAMLCLICGSLLTPVLADKTQEDEPGLIQAANLVYGHNKTSVCFADDFLKQVRDDTHIAAHPSFRPVKLDSGELFNHPFAVMTGEGDFSLTDAQRDNLRTYLEAGGFIIASAGCSSTKWQNSFRKEIVTAFPDRELVILEADHPVFHTVYDITSSAYKSGGNRLPRLEALEIDGRVVLIFSPDGLNDTANAGGNCCCCGGNEIKSAKQLNVNILAYALTH